MTGPVLWIGGGRRGYPGSGDIRDIRNLRRLQINAPHQLSEWIEERTDSSVNPPSNTDTGASAAFPVGQQVPGPIEHGTQRRLSVHPPAGRREQLEPLAHAREQRPRGHHPHPRRRQLDRQRQTLQQLHERGDRRLILGARLESRLRRLCPAHEQCSCVGRRQRRQREDLFSGNPSTSRVVTRNRL